MPSYRVSTQIDAPPDVVYARVADLERHGSWSADPLEITSLGDDRFRSSAVSKGKTIEADLRVIERDPPRTFAFEVADLTGSWVNRFTVTPAGTGSRLEREISGSLTGAQLALFWLVLLPVKKPNARRALANLKERIERDPSAP